MHASFTVVVLSICIHHHHRVCHGAAIEPAPGAIDSGGLLDGLGRALFVAEEKRRATFTGAFGGYVAVAHAKVSECDALPGHVEASRRLSAAMAQLGRDGAAGSRESRRWRVRWPGVGGGADGAHIRALRECRCRAARSRESSRGPEETQGRRHASARGAQGAQGARGRQGGQLSLISINVTVYLLYKTSATRLLHVCTQIG